VRIGGTSGGGPGRRRVEKKIVGGLNVRGWCGGGGGLACVCGAFVAVAVEGGREERGYIRGAEGEKKSKNPDVLT